MGLADRDWYREESSEAFWRELDGSVGRRSSPGGREKASVGLLAAVLVSALLYVVNSQLHVLRSTRHTPLAARTASPVPPAGSTKRPIVLGTLPGFDAVGPAGQRWCVTIAGARYCAVTGTFESGRDALTRVLRRYGYAVADAVGVKS